MLRMNDFPEEPLYTLVVDSREIESFDDFPPAWSKPGLLGHQQHPVRAVGKHDYELSCSVCGAVAMRFTLGEPVETFHGTVGSDRVVACRGITGATSFADDNPHRFLDHLAAGAIANAHAYAQQTVLGPPGLDAYCPECDRIYCAAHYAGEDIFDESFYDYTIGTCPKGHRRMIGD